MSKKIIQVFFINSLVMLASNVYGIDNTARDFKTFRPNSIQISQDPIDYHPSTNEQERTLASQSEKLNLSDDENGLKKKDEIKSLDSNGKADYWYSQD